MIDLQNLVGRLGTVPLFKGLSEAARKEIVFAGQVLNYPAGTHIFNEGEPCSGLYVLFTGQVHLYKLGLQGQETIITIIKPVVLFNEVAVLDGGPNPVTAVAVQDCTVWQVGYGSYQLLMNRYPEVGIGLLKVLAARNRLMLIRYEDLLSRPVLARAAKILLDLSQQGQKPISRNKHSLQEIAAYAATVPEAVSRSLKTLRDKGAIEYTRSRITVISPVKLAEIAQIDPLLLGMET